MTEEEKTCRDIRRVRNSLQKQKSLLNRLTARSENTAVQGHLQEACARLTFTLRGLDDALRELN